MLRTATVHAVTAIGIDMGKNTLHMVGLDTRGTIVLRETSWPSARTFCHHAWYASLLILPVTGGNSMNELNP